MYVLAIVGSNNKNSITKSIIKEILCKLENEKKFEIKIICLNEYNISYCKGCNCCFNEGKCILTNIDKMHLIELELEKAECIIWGTPVYLDNCSGVMKTFIDRMAYKSHKMWYAGKLSFNIITTSNSGGEFVGKYISKVQRHLGTKNLGSYTYVAISENYEDFILKTSNNIGDKIEKNFSWSDVELEKLFQNYYDLYNSTDMGSEIEKSYWRQSKVKSCTSFQEYAILLRKLRSEVGYNERIQYR